MYNKHHHPLFALMRRGLAAIATVALLSLSVASMAQETTTVVRGTVTGPSGGPVPGASVSVTDTRTGSVRRTATNESGVFTVRGLPVGGPYTIRIQSNDFQGAQVTDVFTNLSAAASFDIPLAARDEAIEEIITTAKMVETMAMAIGPGTAFSIEEIEAMPSIARQIRDVIRVDPRVNIARNDNGGGSAAHCIGGSRRSNAITIDGAVANDGFGLNQGTGTSARFAFPIPYDTIASASVEFAPLDVQYSQFTGCAINIVTKPGSNEFHGSAFYLFNDEGLTGDKVDGRTFSGDPFEDTNYGFDVSGPIIKDKLFFTVAYEETDEGGLQNTGPSGAGFANELNFIDINTANQIKGILESQYNRTLGDVVRTLPQTSERIFARLDWNIDDKHRAELTYTELEELNMDPDDCCGSFNGFTFADNFELEGIEQETISLRLFSNWTDNFSTEFRYSFFDVIDIQGPVGGGEAQDPNPIPRIEVEDGAGNILLTSGPGFFRTANDLQYDIEQVKLAADYVWNDHTFTFGWERETRNIFNLFIFDGTGTITFASIADLQAGLASGIVKQGSFTQDPNDAAARFERDIDSFYVQDEWRVSDALTIVAGVRFDDYSTDNAPLLNTRFQQRYGFANNTSFDGLDLVQPRIGLTYDLPTSRWGTTQISAGFGIFGGGDPTVHFANAYQNFGGALGFGDDGDAACLADPNVLQVIQGGSFVGIPACIDQAAADAANALNGAAAAVDPNFELSSNHRWSLGASHMLESDIGFLDGWEIRADYIYTEHKDTVDFVDLRLTPNGVTLPDGRPQFYEVDPTLAGCNAVFAGVRQGFTGDDGPGGFCDDTGNSNQDVLMTNGADGDTTSIAIQFAKTFDFTDSTSLDINFGYAWLDSNVANPVTSSTAGSNYEESAVAILNQNVVAPSLWEIEHNITLAARFKHYWTENNATSVGLFFRRASGRPFSFTYEDDTVEQFHGDSDDEERVLIHVPTGPTDPLYDFTTNLGGRFTQADVDALFALINSSGLAAFAGGIAPRNGFNGPWHSDLDVRISQDIGLWSGHELQIFLDIENFLNLLDDGQNVRRYTNTGDIEEGVRVLQLDENVTNVFEVEDIFFEGNNIDVDDSVYRIQLGIQYRF